MKITGPHVWFEPGDIIDPVDLARIEGPQSAVPCLYPDGQFASAHWSHRLNDPAYDNEFAPFIKAIVMFGVPESS